MLKKNQMSAKVKEKCTHEEVQIRRTLVQNV